jgi:hypothetical protein
MLKDPVRTKLQTVIREYVALRVELASNQQPCAAPCRGQTRDRDIRPKVSGGA